MSDVRNRCAEKSWDVFNKFLEQTQPLNGRYQELFLCYPLSPFSQCFLMNRWKVRFLLQGA